MKNATQFHIRPARPEEAGLFYTPHPEEDKRLGAVGHVRMDFGRSGNEFWHTWWPRGPEELNSPAFKAELQQVVDTLRESVLKSRFAMERFCYDHGGKIDGGYVQNYGYIVETERYRYCLRCNPSPGDYNGYLAVYDLAVQRQNMARDKPLVGRVTYPQSSSKPCGSGERRTAQPLPRSLRRPCSISVWRWWPVGSGTPLEPQTGPPATCAPSSPMKNIAETPCSRKPSLKTASAKNRFQTQGSSPKS